MRVKVIVVFLFFLGSTLVTAAEPNQIRIKMATLAPRGSIWEEAMLMMGQRWKHDTEGKVTLTLYPGGVAGDEAHIVRKIRIGQLQAGMLTTVGLSIIDSSVTALSHVPLLYNSYEELDYVRIHMQDDLFRRMETQGFVVLNWGFAGWVRFFSRDSIHHPDDLRRMKLFYWAGEYGDPSIWRNLGFQVVPLAATDIMMGLQTGMIDAFDTTPLVALSNQWFTAVNFMTDLKWGPLLGATVIACDTWERIPENYRTKMLAAAADMEAIVQKETQLLSLRALTAMKTYGLEIIHPTPADRQAWNELVWSVYPDIRGNLVPARYFDWALELRDAYRDSLARTGF